MMLYDILILIPIICCVYGIFMFAHMCIYMHSCTKGQAEIQGSSSITLHMITLWPSLSENLELDYGEQEH